MLVAGLTQCHVAVINLISANAYAAELALLLAQRTRVTSNQAGNSQGQLSTLAWFLHAQHGTAPLFDWSHHLFFNLPVPVAL